MCVSRTEEDNGEKILSVCLSRPSYNIHRFSCGLEFLALLAFNIFSIFTLNRIMTGDEEVSFKFRFPPMAGTPKVQEMATELKSIE